MPIVAKRFALGAKYLKHSLGHKRVISEEFGPIPQAGQIVRHKPDLEYIDAQAEHDRRASGSD
eukprot:6430192-Amphidinium_carterae.1